MPSVASYEGILRRPAVACSTAQCVSKEHVFSACQHHQDNTPSGVQRLPIWLSLLHRRPEF